MEAISGRLHERCPKKGVLGGEVFSLFFNGKRSIEKLSTKVNIVGRTVWVYSQNCHANRSLSPGLHGAAKA
jgi:hypothetical protein